MCVFVFMFIYYIEAEAMDRHFEDNQSIFLNENICISINISSKCVPKGQVQNFLALVQIMDWRQPSD